LSLGGKVNCRSIGWPLPKKGGLKKSEMTTEQKQRDKAVRLQISAEMGHSRIDVISTYCGQ
jgi:hypothetical protein